MTEAVAKKGPVRWAAWRVLRSNNDTGMIDDVAQTVAMKYLRNHPAEEEMPKSYWTLAGKRVAIDISIKERRFPRNAMDEANENQPLTRRVAMMADPFDIDAWMTLRQIASHPVGREVIASVLKKDSGVIPTVTERQRLYRARKKLRILLDR